MDDKEEWEKSETEMHETLKKELELAPKYDLLKEYQIKKQDVLREIEFLRLHKQCATHSRMLWQAQEELLAWESRIHNLKEEISEVRIRELPLS